jgi:imidazoleglycerol-phosphate dehydratase/histidinol-phosphatase
MSKLQKILFVDRDGTMIKEPADEQVDSFEKLEFYPGALTYLPKIAKELDFELVMVTNQDGLGTPSYPSDTFWPVHNFILKTFEAEGVKFITLYRPYLPGRKSADTQTGYCPAYPIF